MAAFTTPTNPFYTPGSSYGGTQDWRKTPFVKSYLDPQIPEGVFTNFLGARGFGGTDSMSTWAQGQYGKTLSGYKAAMRENPALMYRDYLRGQFSKPSLTASYLGQGARARGENPTAFTGPTRTIALG